MASPKVLMVAFDGLRRDMITPEICPNIHAFRNEGVDFPESASTFPSETRVQVSGFMTGNYPGNHGIMGNAFYDPKLGYDGPMDTSDLDRMAKASEIYGEPVLRGVSLPEAVHRAGKTYVAVSAGKKGNARLLNLEAAKRGQATFSVHGPEVSSPAAEHDAVVAEFGPVPDAGYPSTDLVKYVTDITLGHFIPKHKPDAMMLWFLEPDLTYHFRGVGSPESLAAIGAVDKAFGRILDWWRAEGQAEGWQIMTVSDHGHVSIKEHIDIAAAMRADGFAIGDALGPDVDYAVKSGYMGTIFARDRSPGLTAKMLAWMREQPWAGHLFAHDPAMAVEGAFHTDALNVANERTPDIYFTMRAMEGDNEYGYPGLCLANDAGLPTGGGLHGGLHRIEMNNFMAAGGPMFKSGEVVIAPAGVVDLAPTVLTLLGLPVPASMSGRVLNEALAGGGESPQSEDYAIEAGAGDYHQRLHLSKVSGARQPYPRGAERLN